MADDVGDRLAEDERENALVRRGYIHLLGARLNSHPGGFKGCACARERVLQILDLITADSAADFGKSLARDLFNVGYLGPRTVGNTIEQLAGKLGLQNDERKRMTKDVVKIPGDALALGDFRQSLGRKDMAGGKNVRGTEDHRVDAGIRPVIPRQVHEPGFEADEDQNATDNDDGARDVSGNGKGNEGGCEDDVEGGAFIVGRVYETEQRLAGEHPKHHAPVMPPGEGEAIENKKEHNAEGDESPLTQARMTEVRADEDEADEDGEDERPPGNRPLFGRGGD